MTHTIVPPHTRSRELDAALLGASLVELERLLTAPPLPTADDLAGLPGAFLPPRSVGQHERYGADGFRGIAEGRTFRLELGLGTIACRAFDAARVERAVSRERDRVAREADVRAGRLRPLLDGTELLEDSESVRSLVGASFQRQHLAQLQDDSRAFDALDTARGRRVLEWSAKSRARMVRTFASLDYTPLRDAPGDLAMVTLTYPGRWEDVVPDGATAKRHLRAFQLRWKRAHGAPLVGLWKLEFQRRGAPHFHLLASVPALMPDGMPFASWLSSTWAAVVGAADPLEYARHLAAGTAVDFGTTSRMADHKRIAVYFLKHAGKGSGEKEYQHVVPELWRSETTGPGRFWGFWGLERPVVLVDVDVLDFMTARRVLRRATAARSRHIAYQRARAAAAERGATASMATRAGCAAEYQRPRSFGAGGSLTGGWLLANDGVGLALDVARYLASLRA